MGDLTENTPIDFEGQYHADDFPAAAGEHIREGALLTKHAAGGAEPLVAGNQFLGVALRECDNEDGALDDKKVRVVDEGYGVVDVEGVDGPDDVDTEVFASDDHTHTTTSGGNTSVGKVARHIDGETCLVFYQAAHKRSI